MAFTLDEYCALFALSEADRGVSILGCGDGPSSFNAEGTAQGMRVVSVDPLYDLRAADIRARVEATPVTERFLADYEEGVTQGRYVSGSATGLPFPDGSYDLALCSHQLFVNSEQQNLAHHLQAVRELMRVAEEVRIFPLTELLGVESRHLKAVVLGIQRFGYKAGRMHVTNGSQHEGSELLQITR